MKNNQPITQQEKPFPPGEYLVSKTDLKGVITYCNDAFVELSGFDRDELMGSNHNIVRHPDMPAAAFEDLWNTVKSGYPWRGVVKNRSKNGDHYWVDAFVVPLRKGGATTGYLSVRSEPSRAQIHEAEALYRRLALGEGGSPVSRFRFVHVNIRMRLMAVMGLMALLILGGAILGIGSLIQSSDALTAAYINHLKPAVAIAKMVDRLGDNRAQIMLGLQHDPANPYSKMHDHPIDRHIDRALKNRELVEALRREYVANRKTAEEERLAKIFFEARDRLSDEGNKPARAALAAGDFATAQKVLLTKINPLYDDMIAKGEVLQRYLAEQGERANTEDRSRFEIVRNLSIASAIITLILLVGAGTYLVRTIVVPMRRAVDYFERIAAGDLTNEIDISGRDEPGQLLCALAAMQVNLKIHLDQVRQVSNSLDEQSAVLTGNMGQVVERSMQQHDRVQGAAAAAEELTQSVAEVSASVANTAVAATRSKNLVGESTASMESSMKATSRVVDAVKSSGAAIDDLNRAIEKIGIITKAIREIAEQTNLLALNAAIEAARAGEQGRGFAVVADEVRKLAERTATSTTDINATVSEFQAVTARAVASMEQAGREVEAGIGLMRESVAGLDQILVSSDEVAEMSSHIADAAKEQHGASQHVAISMSEISGLIEQNAQVAKEASHGADALAKSAHELRNVIASFQLIRK